MKVRKYGANLRDKMRGVRRRDTQMPALAIVVTKIAYSKDKVPAPRYQVKPSRVKRLYNQMQGKNLDPDVLYSLEESMDSDAKNDHSRVSLNSKTSMSSEACT